MHKLFIGGISQETTEEDLRDYFSAFGVLSSFVVVRDKCTKISKGYGFISLENKKSYQRILDTKGHVIRGRVVEVNLAVKKNSDAPEDVRTKNQRKLFVGGLRNEATREDLLEYFSGFGAVLNAYIIYNPTTKLTKNFGYVEFEDIRVAEHVLKLKNHVMNGKRISIEIRKNAGTSPGDFPLRQPLQPALDAVDRQPTNLAQTARPPENFEEVEQSEAWISVSVEQGLRALQSDAAQAHGPGSADLQAHTRSFKTGQQFLASQQPAQSVSFTPISRSFCEFYTHLKSLRDTWQIRFQLETQADMSNLRFARWTVPDQKARCGSSQTVLLIRYQSPY